MSWDASLVLPAAVTGGRSDVWMRDWNYTYNVSDMVREAAAACGITYDGMARFLDGRTAGETAVELAAIAVELIANRDRYEAMNPPNGWGTRSGIAQVLAEMGMAAADQPNAVWRAS